MRLMRLMRLARMARLVRLLRALPELMILIKGMFMAARSVLLTMFLLLVIIYVFAIAFTQLSSGSLEFFETVPRSMETLLLHGCFGEDLPDIVYASNDEHPALGALLIAFVLLASLTVMNMLIGVLVEVVSVVASVEKETLQVNFVMSKLAKFLKLEGGLITRRCFTDLICEPEAAKALREVGVDVVGLIDFADFIFDGSDSVPYRLFMDTVLQLRGSNTATVKDIVDLRKIVLTEVMRVETTLMRRLRGVSAAVQSAPGTAIQNRDDDSPYQISE